MRITLSIPDGVARKFRAAVPPQERSRVITTLLAQELARRESTLESACRAANRDPALEREIDEWQAFEDDADA